MKKINFIHIPSKQAALLYRNPVFRAYMPKTMRQTQQNDLALTARAAFELVQQGDDNPDHRDILAGTANVVMVLAEKHCAPDDLAAAIDAQEALLRADCRAAEGKRWGFDAPGRMALLRMLDAHEQMLATFGCAALTDALCTVMARRAKGQVYHIQKAQA